MASPSYSQSRQGLRSYRLWWEDDNLIRKWRPPTVGALRYTDTTIVQFAGAISSETPNNLTQTSLVVTLAQPTVGATNYIWLSANSTGSVDPAPNTPSGWTLLGSSTDGAGPPSQGWLYRKVYQAGDPTTETFTFSTTTNAVAACWAYWGLDPTTPERVVSVGVQTPSSTAKDTDTVTSNGGWIVTGWADRNGGTYTAFTDTQVIAVTHTSSASVFVQHSNGDVAAGSQQRTATGPNTAAGNDFIFELVAVVVAPTTIALPPAATGTGTSYDTSELVTPVATESTGTGASFDALGMVTPNATEGTATGAAYDTTELVTFPATEATGAGASNDALGQVTPNATEATGTGSAADATVPGSTNAAEAVGTGSAYDAAVLVAPAASAATGAGTAYDPTVTTASSTTATPTEAAGTGAAYDAPSSVLGNATGAAGTGTAYDAAVATNNATVAQADPAIGSGAALQPVAGGSGIVPGATTTAQTANNQTNTSLSVTLPTASVDDTIVVDILIYNSGIDTDPGFTVPAGWTQVGYALDTTGGAGAAPFGTSIYRRVQAGDPATLNLTWTVAGQGVAIATAYQYVRSVSPIDGQSVEGKGTTNTSYTVDVTTSQTTLIRSWFGNRSGHTYSALGDVSRGSVTLASASSMVAQDTNGMVSAGTYTKTATGSGNTQAGIEAAYALVFGLPITNLTATPTVATGSGAANNATALDDRVGGGATGNNASPSITLSSQIKPGQVVLIHIALNNSDNIVSTPADLTQIDTVAVGTANAADHVYYHIADAITPGRTLTWGLGATRNWAITYLAFSRVDQQSDIIINDAAAVGDNVAATTSFTMPNIAPSADSYVVEVFAAKGNGVGITSLGEPAGYTPRAEVNNGAAFGMSSGIADRTANPSAPGSYGGDVWTTDQAAVTTIRHVIALRVADTAQAANSVGEAPDAYPTVTVYPAEAAGSGAAPFDPNGVTTSTTLIADNPLYAVGTAYDPLVATAPFTTATPTEAAGSGSAYSTTIEGRALPAAATATGDPQTPTFLVGAVHTVNTGTGVAYDPGVATSQPGPAVEATATGSAYNATISTANQAIAPPDTTLGAGVAYNPTVTTFSNNDRTVQAGVAQGYALAFTVFGYDVGVLLRIARDSLPGWEGERWLLSASPRRRATVTTYTEIGLFIGDDGTVTPVDVDAPATSGELIRNPSVLLVEPNSAEADALIAAGYTLEPVS